MSAEAGAVLAAAEGLDVRLAGRIVLEAVSIAVHEGEIVTLIGPNGSGKTTLVRAILGLVPPARGTVRRRPGLRVGYMPQRLMIDPVLPLTVARFLALAAPDRNGRIETALAEVGAEGLAATPVQEISGGELQRVLLARALLRAPDLLVLDEPAQGVDLSGQDELFELITGLRDQRGCGVLMVSHDLHLVMATTDTVVCLNRHVCCTGRPETVSRDPEYLALFGARAARSLALYAHDHDHRHAAGGGVVPLAEGGANERGANEGGDGPPGHRHG